LASQAQLGRKTTVTPKEEVLLQTGKSKAQAIMANGPKKDGQVQET
jgi:hypothetical protein